MLLRLHLLLLLLLLLLVLLANWSDYCGSTSRPWLTWSSTLALPNNYGLLLNCHWLLLRHRSLLLLWSWRWLRSSTILLLLLMLLLQFLLL